MMKSALFDVDEGWPWLKRASAMQMNGMLPRSEVCRVELGDEGLES